MATSTEIALGALATDFRLPGTDGRTYAVEDVAGEKGTVIVFICNHCPYVKAVIDRLVADARTLMAGHRLRRDLLQRCRGYPADSFAAMGASPRRTHFRFPTCTTSQIARAYGAVCTPDFFGYDANRRLKYRGRLDEGRTSPPPAGARRELVEAMRAIAATGMAPSDSPVDRLLYQVEARARVRTRRKTAGS